LIAKLKRRKIFPKKEKKPLTNFSKMMNTDKRQRIYLKNTRTIPLFRAVIQTKILKHN
jgi:hypothetical protein